MTEDRIRDIPSLKELERNIATAKAIKASMPLLRPLLRLLRVDLAQIEALLKNIDEVKPELLLTLADRFNERFVPRGWTMYESMNVAVALLALDLADGGDVESAESVLVEHYSDETVTVQLRFMNGVAAFRPRMRLAELALGDFKAGRYHASVPVVLAMADGLVNELSAKRRGLFAREAELTAWDSITAHDKGLAALIRVLSTMRSVTTEVPLEVPYRNGRECRCAIRSREPKRARRWEGFGIRRGA
ncbi:MAG: hypothetical protein HW416_1841 [Chloroflexi bacterium]|nr:hypothetical protein [Chloroflexota bacterium]